MNGTYTVSTTNRQPSVHSVESALSMNDIPTRSSQTVLCMKCAVTKCIGKCNFFHSQIIIYFLKPVNFEQNQPGNKYFGHGCFGEKNLMYHPSGSHGCQGLPSPRSIVRGGDTREFPFAEPERYPMVVDQETLELNVDDADLRRVRNLPKMDCDGRAFSPKKLRGFRSPAVSCPSLVPMVVAIEVRHRSCIIRWGKC